MTLPLTAVLADPPDPRMEAAGTLHALTDILVIATCAAIAGADGWEGTPECGRTKETFFRRFLGPKDGVPSHDASARVFARPDPDALAGRFGRWAARACEAAGLARVAADGKPARRPAKGTLGGCPHRVSARAAEARLIPGRRPVPEGGHGITTAPARLAALDRAGAVVARDAAGCRKAAAGQIRRQGGGSVACVKGHQRGRHGAAAGVFGRAIGADFAGCGTASGAGAGHGREEERYVTAAQGPEGPPPGWAGGGAVALVGRERRAGGQQNESTARYYGTGPRAGAAGLAGYIRNHWGIGTGRHWGAGRGVPGGRQPHPGRARGGEPGAAAAGGRVAAEAGGHPGGHQDRAHESGAG